jgi:hypothetical protein
MRQRPQGPGNGDSLEGRYANYFEIGHNAFEFLVDFGQVYTEAPEGRMHTRIVTSPIFARRLADVLSQALRQYEQIHGPVPGAAEATGGDARMDNIRQIHALKTP